MRIRNTSQGYGAVAMALHWAVVVLVFGSWLTGQFHDALPKGVAREIDLFVHNTSGLAIVGLVLIRLVWRIADPPPAPEQSSFGRWVERAGQAAHYLIYLLLIAVPAVGIVAQFARGNAVPVFGLFEIASPWLADRSFAHSVTEVHEVLANALLVLVGLHAAAALVHHYLLHDRTLLRMLPGSHG